MRKVTGDRSADTMRIVGACVRAGLTLDQTRSVVATRDDLRRRLEGRKADDVAKCWERAEGNADGSRSDGYGTTTTPTETTATTPPTEPDTELGEDWKPLDLTEMMRDIRAGTLQPPRPEIGELSDRSITTGAEGEPTVSLGVVVGALFYLASVNGVAGDSNAGKTWLMLAVTLQELRKGNHAVYVDFEGAPHRLLFRLVALGATDEEIARFHYISPQSPAVRVGKPWESVTPTAGLMVLVDQVATIEPTFVVIDSAGEGLARDGVRPNEDDDVARWFSLVPRRIADRGPAVVLVDHMTKASGGDDLWPSGSHRKRGAITGAQYSLKQVVPFNRTDSGHSVIRCAKDREGHAKAGQVVGRMMVCPDEDDTTTIDLVAAAPGDPAGTGSAAGRADALMRKVIDWVTKHPGCSQKELKDGLAVHLNDLKPARDAAKEAGELHQGGSPWRGAALPGTCS